MRSILTVSLIRPCVACHQSSCFSFVLAYNCSLETFVQRITDNFSLPKQNKRAPIAHEDPVSRDLNRYSSLEQRIYKHPIFSLYPPKLISNSLPSTRLQQFPHLAEEGKVGKETLCQERILCFLDRQIQAHPVGEESLPRDKLALGVVDSRNGENE